MRNEEKVQSASLMDAEMATAAIRTRRARPVDAPLLAWAMLTASRGHVKKGYWDLFIPDSEEQRLAFLTKLILAEPGPPSHWSVFTVAELEGEPASVLSGYRVGQFAKKECVGAMREAARAMGWIEHEELAASKRAEHLVPCYPDSLEGLWVIENVATLPGYRGAGATTLLMERSIGEGREAGLAAVELQAAMGNRRAERFYERIGFVPFAEIRVETVHEMLGYPGVVRLILDLRSAGAREEESIQEMARRLVREQEQRSKVDPIVKTIY